MKTRYLEVNSEEMARNRHLDRYLKEIRPSGSSVYVGLGTGINIPILLHYFDHVAVVEPEGEILDRFSRIHPNLVGGAVTLIQKSLEDVSIDVAVGSVFLIGVSEHLFNVEAALDKLDRLALPQADVFLIFNNPRSLHRQFGVATGHIKNCFEITEPEGPRGHGHYQLFEVKDVLSLLSKLRFRPIKVTGFYVKPLPTFLTNSLASHLVSGFMDCFVHLPPDQHAFSFVHARRK